MTRRRTLAGVGCLCVFVVLVILAVANASFRHGLDKTASLASWAVAAGTLGLAAATVLLAKKAGEEAKAVLKEAKQVGEQVTLQRQQLEASRRPVVFPSLSGDPVDLRGQLVNQRLELKNGGPGVAVNASGRVYWPGSRPPLTLHVGSIAPMDSVVARLSDYNNDWDGGMGFVRYLDIDNRGWVTFFFFYEGEGHQVMAANWAPETFTDTTDPDRLDEDGLSRKMDAKVKQNLETRKRTSKPGSS